MSATGPVSPSEPQTAPAFVLPDWPVPATVRAATTLRTGGVSAGVWRGLNVADHVGDDDAKVAANRALLAAALALPGPPAWLNQVHGHAVACEPAAGAVPTADAAVTTRAGRVLAILTADCLPVLFCRRDGAALGAAHAGWRGLAGGVLEATLAALPGSPADYLAWLGPAIGPAAFEVGAEVRAAFTAPDPGAAVAFAAGDNGKYYADLYALARRRLQAAGVGDVCGGGDCTYTDPERYYSYRRDGQCGRMATLIWLCPEARHDVTRHGDP